jgi:nitroimidazol reductase NimA-like FMN-containing flavoprotein (pyridoxamine 5'-phosphate oxidase superfamily)
MTLAMTRRERESFLAGLHVAIVAVEEPGRSPLVTPVWYSYEPGGAIRFVTARQSHKADLVARSHRLSLIAQTQELPYKYVAVQGSARVLGTAGEAERRALAHRYLGPEFGDAYMEAAAEADDVVVELIPDTWRTVDFSKMMA